MRATEYGDSTSRSVVCPNCGYAVEPDWSFCSCCGHQLGNNHSSPSSSVESPARHATAISTSDLPNVVGIPGRIIGVKIYHGWAAACGYFDIHEVVDGRAVKTWLDYHDEDQDAWFARPLPDKVDLIDPPYLPSVHGGACDK